MAHLALPGERVSEPANHKPRYLPRRPLRITAVALFLGSTTAILFLALPQFALLLRGIQTHGWERLPNTGISEALFLSLVTTALSSLLTIVVGTPLAYVLSRWRFVGRRLLIVIVELPIVLPPTVAGLAEVYGPAL